VQNLVSKKGIKKKSIRKPNTNKIIKKSPAAEQKAPDDTLKKVESAITSKVVLLLAPEMNKAIETKFDEMKTIFTNELKDIRNHMEATPADPVLDPPTMTTNEAGLTAPQAQEKAGLDSLLPIIQMLGLGGQQGQGGLNNMFMEAIMRKSLADITRGDMMNEMMSKAMYKKLSGGDDMPDGITDTTDSLMNPLRKYGENAKKS
jgi:hypothetical protein